MPRILSGLGALAITGPAAFMLFCLVCGRSAHGFDPTTTPHVRIAALHENQDQAEPSERQIRAERDDLSDWLMAQSGPPNAGEESREAIFAKFPLSAPETVEEDVGKQFDLELVRRSTNDSRKERVVLFRVPSTRKATEIVDALRVDPRIISVQLNVRYVVTPDTQPPPQTSDLRQAPVPKAENRRASRPTPKLVPPGKGEGRPDESFKTAPGMKAARPISPSGREASLATRSHAALRWPAADEPFVNVGMTNR